MMSLIMRVVEQGGPINDNEYEFDIDVNMRLKQTPNDV